MFFLMIGVLMGLADLLLIAVVISAYLPTWRFRRLSGLGVKRVQNIRIPTRLKPRCVKKIKRGLDRAARKSRPVVLLIDSGGGSAVATYSIIELLNAHPGPVFALVINRCKSGATLITCAVPVENRYILPGNMVMIHAAYSGKFYKDTHETRAATARIKAAGGGHDSLNEWMATYLEETTRLDGDFLRQLFETGGDLYFNPEQACDLGLIGTIIK